MPGIIPPGPGIQQALTPLPASPPPAEKLPADGFRGYADLRNTVAHHLNRHLYNAARLDAETWRIIGRKRRVRR